MGDLRRVKSIEPVEGSVLVADGAAKSLPPDGHVCFDVIIGDKFTRTYHIAVDNASRAQWIESLLHVTGRSAAAVMTVDAFVDLRNAQSDAADIRTNDLLAQSEHEVALLEEAAAEVEERASAAQEGQQEKLIDGMSPAAPTKEQMDIGSVPAGALEANVNVDVDVDTDFGWAFKLTSGVWQRKFFSMQAGGSKRLCFFEDAERSEMKGVMDLRRVKSIEPVEGSVLVADGVAKSLPPDGHVCFDVIIGDKFTRTYHVAVDNASRAQWIESLLHVTGRSAAAVMTVDAFVDLRHAQSDAADSAQQVFAETMGEVVDVASEG